MVRNNEAAVYRRLTDFHELNQVDAMLVSPSPASKGTNMDLFNVGSAKNLLGKIFFKYYYYYRIKEWCEL